MYRFDEKLGKEEEKTWKGERKDGMIYHAVRRHIVSSNKELLTLGKQKGNYRLAREASEANHKYSV